MKWSKTAVKWSETAVKWSKRRTVPELVGRPITETKKLSPVAQDLQSPSFLIQNSSFLIHNSSCLMKTFIMFSQPCETHRKPPAIRSVKT